MGSPTPTSNSENNLLTILESQNRHFSELLKEVQNSQRHPKNSNAIVFNPERTGSDAQSKGGLHIVRKSTGRQRSCDDPQQVAGRECISLAVSDVLSCHNMDTVSQMVTSLMARWKSLSVEQIAVSVALAHAAGMDRRLRRLVLTTNIDIRNELQQELKAYSFDARPSQHPNNTSAPTGKQAKLYSHIKCHNCGKTGHKKAECR